MLHPTYPFSNTCILGSPSCSTSMEAELSQCTSGNGLPVATQSKSAVLPSSNCCISGEVVTLGVAGEGGGGVRWSDEYSDPVLIWLAMGVKN